MIYNYLKNALRLAFIVASEVRFVTRNWSFKDALHCVRLRMKKMSSTCTFYSLVKANSSDAFCHDM